MNEIEGMKKIMPRIKKHWVDEILIIDGGSTDGTFEYAKSNPDYITVKQQSEGLTDSYWEALKVATGDIIITFSPDGNSVPERIPELISKMKEGYDMVVVSRYREAAKSEDDDMVTAFGNWMFTKMINILFGGHYTDTLVMFRAWKRDVLALCSKIDAKRAGLEPHLSIQCAKRKLRVGEIAGDEPKRIGGVRKMSPLKNGWGVLVLIFKEFVSREKAK
ncbi:glycosyltransferase family 2 protein [Acidobacteria bacterium AH-259-G07]|nr:glycosyltransferase family 2 protein [Acidobacteria bacterium AH-259-G07]